MSQTQPEPVLYTVRESTRYLATSPATLFRLTARGKLPAVRIGRRKLYRKADLDNFVATLSEPVAA